jgi:heme/copper-type cytochrome/quinol oxidase subunit 3
MKLGRKIVASTSLLLLLGSLIFIFLKIYEFSRPPQPGEMNEAGLILVIFYIA